MADDDQPVLSNNVKELLEKAKPELMAIPAKEIVHRTITRDRVLSLTKVMYASWREFKGLLDKELHPDRAKERKGQIAGLRGRARVFYGADLSAQDPSADTNKIGGDELAVLVAGYDRQLYKWAKPLFGDDPVKAATLRDISRGHGKRDDANDVLRLAKMFRDNWAMAEGKTEITEALLDKAEASAHEQLELLSGNPPNVAKDLAARAYTAWYRDYVQLRRLGFYLLGHLPDAAQRFPGVHTPSSRRAESEPPVKLEELEDDEDEEGEEQEQEQEEEQEEGDVEEEEAGEQEQAVEEQEPEDEEEANQP